MIACLTARAGARAVPVTPLNKGGLKAWLAGAPAAARSWVKACAFAAEAGELCLVPDGKGGIARVLAGTGEDDSHWAFAGLPGSLPQGRYRLDPAGAVDAAALGARVALGWALGSYAFTRYRERPRSLATLAWPAGVDRAAVTRAADAIFMVRDLINTPAADMGPAELAAAARRLARRHGARCTVTVGEALLRRGYPAIHAVGRAGALARGGGRRDRRPRLVDLRWGRSTAPRLTLVGKGVCFDSGGLNLKSDSAMRLMKKDMAGAAHMLGLAAMIMEAGLDVRLRVLVPAVDNSISADAMRPLDVIATRKGLTVEVGHTDAEGRLVLCDALAEASREKPALLIDVATLTGAARVALGTDVPALFCNDDDLAAAILRHAEAEADPLWRLPLWRPYREGLESQVADLSNVAAGPYGGAITAALFLSEFVAPGIPWAHLDMMAWNTKARPGRPEGGEANGLRALFAVLCERFGPAARSPARPRAKAQRSRSAKPGAAAKPGATKKKAATAAAAARRETARGSRRRRPAGP